MNSHTAKKTEASRNAQSSPGKKKKRGFIDKFTISRPSSFKHVAHMGYDAEKGFTAENVDPSWAKLLEQLSSLGISEAQIKDNEDFIKDFVKSQGGEAALAQQPPARQPPPPAPAARRAPAPAAPRA